VDGRWHINGEVTSQRESGRAAPERPHGQRHSKTRSARTSTPRRTPTSSSRRFHYIAHGIRAFTLNLQGGMPGYEGR
jgi:hypothetical protein